MSFNHFEPKLAGRIFPRQISAEYKDSLFIAALSPSFAYGIGQGTRRNKRALGLRPAKGVHPDADPERNLPGRIFVQESFAEDWVQRGASHLLAKRQRLRPD